MRPFAPAFVPLAVVAGASVLMACTGILGVRDIFLDGKTGEIVSEAGPGSDGATIDASAPDAQLPCNADKTSDTANCGACGHDCLGGACNAGKCQPVQVVFSASSQPYGLAVDGQNLYYSNVVGDGLTGGTVLSVAKNAVAGTGVVIAKTTDPLIYDVVSDGTQVYIASGSVSYSNGRGSVETFLPDGGARRTISRGTVPRGLAVDSMNAYWAAPNDTPITIQGAAKTAVDAGATTVMPNEDGAESLVISGDRLFWTNDSSGGAVRRCTLTGTTPSCSAPTTVHPNLDGPQAIATSSTLVIYGASGLLYAQPKSASGGTPAPFAKNQPQTVGIVADDNDVYWINTGTNNQSFKNGDVRHCPIVAGQPQCPGAGDGEVLATSERNPRVIVMDKKAIYWTVQYEGAVWRLAR